MQFKVRQHQSGIDSRKKKVKQRNLKEHVKKPCHTNFQVSTRSDACDTGPYIMHEDKILTS